jgi:hypothetical protein
MRNRLDLLAKLRIRVESESPPDPLPRLFSLILALLGRIRMYPLQNPLTFAYFRIDPHIFGLKCQNRGVAHRRLFT